VNILAVASQIRNRGAHHERTVGQNRPGHRPHPRRMWVITAVLLACAWLGLAVFKVGTLTTAQSFRGAPASVTVEQVLARYFPGGSGDPGAVTPTPPRPLRFAPPSPIL